MKTAVQKIPFEQALKFWRATLWADRRTPIEPTSAMVFGGGHDLTICQQFEPVFFGIFAGAALVAVNSGHRSSPTHYRTRGLFVAEPFRRQGLAQRLFSALAEQALLERAALLWSYPRESAFPAYRAFGFAQAGDWLRDVDTQELRHCYAGCVLSDVRLR